MSQPIRTPLTLPVPTGRRAFALFGGVEIIVPPGVHVEVDGNAILGGWSKRLSDEPMPANAPVIPVKGLAILGDVEVKFKEPRRIDHN